MRDAKIYSTVSFSQVMNAMRDIVENGDAREIRHAILELEYLLEMAKEKEKINDEIRRERQTT